MLQTTLRDYSKKNVHLRKHELHQHVEAVRAEVRAGRVAEVLDDELECSRGAEEVVHGGLQPVLRAAVLPRAQLRVQAADVEQDRRLLEGDGLLGAGDAREAVVPLEEEAGLPVRGVEPPLHEVQLVVVLEQQRDPVPVPARCPHRLHQQSLEFLNFYINTASI